MVKKSIVLMGTGSDAPWHPLAGVEADFRGLLSDLGNLEVSLNPNRLVALDHDGTGLLVCYADAWETPLGDDQMAGLLRFAAGGGRILVIHSGLSYQKRPEFVGLAGARFTEHPPMTVLSFRSLEPDHPICQRLAPVWELEEEPYRFEFSAAAEVQILYEYKHEGAWYPAAWTTHFGRGDVVYLMPGHAAASLRHPEYGELVRSAARWLLR